MAVELNRLIEKVSHMDITLIAGERGLANVVSWVHMIETKEASSFLEGGEIAFSTGIGLNNSLSILDLVENIWENHAAGIVLNIGPFLESIPPEVIDFGNTHDFPIFTVPWKIHIAEIMRIFSFTITKSDQANLEVAAAFKNAIFFPKQEELYVVPLSQRGFHLNWNYYVCVIKILQSGQQPVASSRLETVSTEMDNCLRHRKFKKYAVFYNENQLLIVIGNYTEEALNSLINTTKEQLNRCLIKSEIYYMGIGKSTKSIRCLYKSYNQAISIQKLQENSKISRSLISYSNMGIYKLLMGIEDPDILTEYYEKTVLPLVEYDKKNDSDLALVLRSYLNHNGSVKETADELFVHRNTINYKLNKISELLNLSLSNLDTRLQLSLGFMLQDML